MSSKQILTNTLKASNALTSTLLSMKEYMTSALSKLQAVTSGLDISHRYVTLPAKLTIGANDIDVNALFDSNQIRSAINGEVETITGFINDSHDTVTLTSDEVVDAIEQTASDLQIQSEFISSCLSENEVTFESFSSSVLSRFKSVIPATLTQYAELFNVGDKIQALKAWISQSLLNKYQVVGENQYIELIDKSQYTGVSVWSVVLLDFQTGANNFFSRVKQAMDRMDNLVKALWSGISTLAKKLASVAFRYLTSNLSKSSSKIGVLDYPIIQLSLGTIHDVYGSYSQVTVNSAIEDAWNDIRGNTSIRITNVSNSSSYFQPSLLSYQDLKDRLERIVNYCMMTGITDPRTGGIDDWLFKICEVTIPCGDGVTSDGVVIRVGKTTEGEFSLSVYCLLQQSVLDNYDDAQIFAIVKDSLSDAWQYLISMNFPVWTSFNDWGGDINKILEPYYCLDKIITPLSSSEQAANSPVDFASHFRIGRNSDLTFSDSPGSSPLSYDHGIVWLLVMGFLGYFEIMSPVCESNGYLSRNDDDHELYVFGYYALMLGMKGWVGMADDTIVPIDWDTCYKPYLSYNITPSSIHLQTITERAKEIEWTIIAALIAIVTIAATVKFIKFRRNLALKTEIARAQCDSFAWDMDPSKASDLSTYKSLRRTARRYERISSLFGLTSMTAAQVATSSIVDGVFDYSKSMHLDSNSKDDNNTHDVITAVDGVTTLIKGN